VEKHPQVKDTNQLVVSNTKDQNMSIPKYPPVDQGVKIKDYPKAMDTDQTERLAGFRKIVDERQCQPVRWIDRSGKKRQVTVDHFSASIVLNVYGAMSPEQREVFCALEPPGMVRFAMKCA
jgi:hypothetical protein